MRIEHVAIWTYDLERMKNWYVNTFGAIASDKYSNTSTGFESYFLSWEDGARLELMARPDICDSCGKPSESVGLAHMAISVGSRQVVDSITERLRLDGTPIIAEPRRTGDGYYESVVTDPDGNRIEICE